MRTLLIAVIAALVVSPLGSAPGTSPTESPCYLTVKVPVGATLLVNGARTSQMTATRSFVSPALPIGQKFYYTFTASWTQDGEPVGTKKQVEVTAGANLTIDMIAEPLTRVGENKTVPASPFEAPEAEAKKPVKPEIEVPYVSTPNEVVKEMLKLANVKEGDSIIDLGCGDGRIVIAAIKDFKAKKGAGVDFNPERIKESEAAAKKAGVEGKVKFWTGDVLKLKESDLEGMDVVTLYLLPEVNIKLRPLLQKMKPGTRIVSHDFDMGDWEADKTTTIVDEFNIAHQVYLWTIKKQ